jgi:hypothetical protein
MARLIPAAERLRRAGALIQQARELPVPAIGGRGDFSYIANVKDLMRQARDLIKFIPMSPSATDEMKAEVKRLYEEAERAEQEILHGKPPESAAG